MNIISEYTIAIVVAICLACGYIIKHSLTFIPKKYIPLIMGVLGVIVNMWLNKFSFTPQILLGGLASGLAATGAFEAVKNMKNGSK